ncbi:uncharacterized protein LOC102358795 isoform X2 [Latimeria chalumnae]|nr:PREDICTED: uncharacterized protein LOC102358795 isoform X2 [Latimeria chalumnae]|eukprot:XP_006006404.1 PREDICTED: uncharacterized protein LOC102358795 isoform X2 [Latimeria chalumnae]
MEAEYGEAFLLVVEKLFWEYLERLESVLPQTKIDQLLACDAESEYLSPGEQVLATLLQKDPQLLRQTLQLLLEQMQQLKVQDSGGSDLPGNRDVRVECTSGVMFRGSACSWSSDSTGFGRCLLSPANKPILAKKDLDSEVRTPGSAKAIQRRFIPSPNAEQCSEQNLNQPTEIPAAESSNEAISTGTRSGEAFEYEQQSYRRRSEATLTHIQCNNRGIAWAGATSLRDGTSDLGRAESGKRCAGDPNVVSESNTDKEERSHKNKNTSMRSVLPAGATARTGTQETAAVQENEVGQPGEGENEKGKASAITPFENIADTDLQDSSEESGSLLDIEGKRGKIGNITLCKETLFSTPIYPYKKGATPALNPDGGPATLKTQLMEQQQVLKHNRKSSRSVLESKDSSALDKPPLFSFMELDFSPIENTAEEFLSPPNPFQSQDDFLLPKSLKNVVSEVLHHNNLKRGIQPGSVEGSKNDKDPYRTQEACKPSNQLKILVISNLHGDVQENSDSEETVRNTELHLGTVTSEEAIESTSSSGEELEARLKTAFELQEPAVEDCTLQPSQREAHRSSEEVMCPAESEPSFTVCKINSSDGDHDLTRIREACVLYPELQASGLCPQSNERNMPNNVQVSLPLLFRYEVGDFSSPGCREKTKEREVRANKEAVFNKTMASEASNKSSKRHNNFCAEATNAGASRNCRKEPCGASSDTDDLGDGRVTKATLTQIKETSFSHCAYLQPVVHLTRLPIVSLQAPIILGETNLKSVSQRDSSRIHINTNKSSAVKITKTSERTNKQEGSLRRKQTVSDTLMDEVGTSRQAMEESSEGEVLSQESDHSDSLNTTSSSEALHTDGSDFEYYPFCSQAKSRRKRAMQLKCKLTGKFTKSKLRGEPQVPVCISHDRRGRFTALKGNFSKEWRNKLRVQASRQPRDKFGRFLKTEVKSKSQHSGNANVNNITSKPDGP